MPRFSPTRKVFTSVSKDIKDIPFQEVFEIYKEAQQQVLADAETYADEVYQTKIKRLEQNYNDNNPEEGAYEGNFDEVVSKPKVSVPAGMIEKATTDAINAGFLKKYGIEIHSDWIMPQVVTLLGSMPTYKNSNGKLSGLQFKRNNFTSDWLKGIFTMTMISTKGGYLKYMYKSPAKDYAALTPLVLYSQKLVKGTLYNEWDPEEIGHIVHSELAEAMLYEVPELTLANIIANRTEGLTIKSGASKGEVKNPLTTSRLTGLSNPDFRQIPYLVQIMLTQIWLAHPANRTKYMILDPSNWDNKGGMPVPIIAADVLRGPNTGTASSTSSKLVTTGLW
jgi:hypothetical protein